MVGNTGQDFLCDSTHVEPPADIPQDHDSHLRLELEKGGCAVSGNRSAMAVENIVSDALGLEADAVAAA
jgi:hypothetical protein